MAESSACLLRSFSQPSPTSQESTEGDALHRALTSSVSFGRFVSESLAWEKWSSFSQNHYLEEAEKYSKPGSVAEKKAYFEAHYKKIAANKAAALLEQAVDDTSVVNMTNGYDDNSPRDIEPAQECEHIKIDEMQGENTLNTDFVFPVDANLQSLPKERIIECSQTEGVDQAIEHCIFSENLVESSNQLQGAINIHDNQELKTLSKGASSMGYSASSEKKETAFYSTKSSKHNHEPKIRSSVKPKIPIYPRKRDHATSPFSKKAASQSLENKRSIPKSLHMSINFTSNETSAPVSQKIVDSRLFKTVARTSKESSNQQTPTRASMGGISKHLSFISQLEKGRTKTLLDPSISQSTSRDRASKSPLMQAQSPIVSSSFSLRSEERAAKRKEFFQKLEQKLNTKDPENEQHQYKQKVKAKGDSKDVRRSVSSKAEANADFPLGTKSASIGMKKISMLSCSPKIDRKLASEMQDNNSRPPWRLSMKTDSFREVIGKNIRPPAYTAKLVPKKTMHENTSPNIQL